MGEKGKIKKFGAMDMIGDNKIDIFNIELFIIFLVLLLDVLVFVFSFYDVIFFFIFFNVFLF